jgi:hypothetical protein
MILWSMYMNWKENRSKKKSEKQQEKEDAHIAWVRELHPAPVPASKQMEPAKGKGRHRK